MRSSMDIQNLRASNTEQTNGARITRLRDIPSRKQSSGKGGVANCTTRMHIQARLSVSNGRTHDPALT